MAGVLRLRLSSAPRRTRFAQDDNPKEFKPQGLIGTFGLYIKIAACLKLGVTGNGTAFLLTSSFEQILLNPAQAGDSYSVDRSDFEPAGEDDV